MVKAVLGDMVFFAAVLLANLVQTVTGFAGTVLVMPLAINMKGTDIAVPLLNLLALLMCGYIAVRNYKSIVWREFLGISVVMAGGVAAGMYIYSAVQLDILLKLYGVFIVCIALYYLLKKDSRKLGKLPGIVILLAAGLVQGVFVSGGPLLVIYLIKKIEEKQEFRATISAVWVVTNGILMFRHLAKGMITGEVGYLLLLTIPALVIGVYIGNKIFEKVNKAVFLKVSYAVLFVSGLYIIL